MLIIFMNNGEDQIIHLASREKEYEILLQWINKYSDSDVDSILKFKNGVHISTNDINNIQYVSTFDSIRSKAGKSLDSDRKSDVDFQKMQFDPVQTKYVNDKVDRVVTKLTLEKSLKYEVPGHLNAIEFTKILNGGGTEENIEHLKSCTFCQDLYIIAERLMKQNSL